MGSLLVSPILPAWIDPGQPLKYQSSEAVILTALCASLCCREEIFPCLIDLKNLYKVQLCAGHNTLH